MLSIIRVGALDNEMLDIELSNGSLVLLNLLPLLEKNGDLAALQQDGRILTPLTDGRGVYWRNGPWLGLEEIMTQLTLPENHD